MRRIDLRSDTVTKPTAAMREAMARAEVGDDVYGEDPTVNRLQEMGAAMLGKEAGLFVPSGTMGNLAAILAHCGRGDEIILGRLAHTFLYEAGGASALGGVSVFPVENGPDGTIPIDRIRESFRSDDAHFPHTSLIALENTHNRCGGTAVSAEYSRQVGALAAERGVRLHLDGARIFNAAVALGVDPANLAAPFDSVTFCLSKGLSAPVGSILCGSRDFIKKAHRARKQLGGGMRQAGVLAAAGIVSLTEMVERLSDDHANAARLAAGLGAIAGLRVEPVAVRTNMVFIELSGDSGWDAARLASNLRDEGILAGVVGARRIRLVTHKDVNSLDIDETVEAFGRILGG
ncbi:MAG TPA: low-specificity L-threonine aldolase [Anaerolineales bacterium]|nr:low-specificity L-threonine aldolase [Anaerolineales bacterium]